MIEENIQKHVTPNLNDVRKSTESSDWMKNEKMDAIKLPGKITEVKNIDNKQSNKRNNQSSKVKRQDFNLK